MQAYSKVKSGIQWFAHTKLPLGFSIMGKQDEWKNSRKTLISDKPCSKKEQKEQGRGTGREGEGGGRGGRGEEEDGGVGEGKELLGCGVVIFKR